MIFARANAPTTRSPRITAATRSRARVAVAVKTRTSASDRDARAGTARDDSSTFRDRGRHQHPGPRSQGDVRDQRCRRRHHRCQRGSVGQRGESGAPPQRTRRHCGRHDLPVSAVSASMSHNKFRIGCALPIPGTGRLSMRSTLVCKAEPAPALPPLWKISEILRRRWRAGSSDCDPGHRRAAARSAGAAAQPMPAAHRHRLRNHTPTRPPATKISIVHMSALKSTA